MGRKGVKIDMVVDGDVKNVRVAILFSSRWDEAGAEAAYDFSDIRLARMEGRMIRPVMDSLNAQVDVGVEPDGK